MLGADIQFGVTDKFSFEIISFWIGIPIIGTLKYSFEIGECTNFGIGILVGLMGLNNLGFGGALPFASSTFGDLENNINFSAGYGAVWFEGIHGKINEERVFSVGGVKQLTKRL